MLIVLDQNYRPIATSDMTITQGDAALGRLYVVAPPAVGISVAFVLPDETITQKYGLFMNPSLTTETVNNYVYTLNVTSDIFTAVPGKLLIQLYASINGSDGTAQTYAVAPIEMNVLRGAVTIPQAGKDIPSDETWTSLLTGISALSSAVTNIQKNAVTELTGQNNMWSLKTGYYKLVAGAFIDLTRYNSTGRILNEREDMLLWVDNKNRKNATFIAMNAPNRDSTGGMPSDPTFFYGYSDGMSNYSRKEFALKTYAEPYTAGYGISITGQEISVSLPQAEIQSV